MGAALKFKQTNVPRQKGETARLKVVRGSDFGSVFVITGGRATVGRGEENDIVLSDLKASRQHLEFILAQNGWYARDMGSANGIQINGKVTREGYVQTRDSVSVGETVLEFLGGEQPTMMLVAPARSVAEVERENLAIEAQKQKVQALGRVIPGMPAGGGAVVGGAKKDSKRTLMLFLGAGAMFYLLYGTEETPPPKKPKKSDGPAVALEQYLPSDDAPSVSRAAEMFFKNGFREYSQGNFLRAKAQFETVLQMAPNHPLALLYMTNCENKIKEEVKAHLDIGRKGLNAGRLKEAKGHFEAVMRLLYRDQLNPGFIEARDQLKKTMALIRGEPEDIPEKRAEP